MSELAQLIRSLAILSWRYSTFRGNWGAMPSSTGLCIALGLLSLAAAVLMVWIEYGWLATIPLPAVWLSSVWMITSENGGLRLNIRLTSAVFLLSIPLMLFMALIGSGHLYIEVLMGVYLSATTLTLIARE